MTDNDIRSIQKLIDAGYISMRNSTTHKHSHLGLYILNYTPKCQYDWEWNKYTIMCRGLIVDKNWNIVARPFQKFFTMEQYQGLRNKVHNLYGIKYKEILNQGDFVVHDKMDGALGILFKNPQNNQVEIATRGSFRSPQAQTANRILEQKYKNAQEIYNPQYTHLFEIISPEHQIVVDYKNEEKLVLIATIDNKTGKDVEFNQNVFPTPEKFQGQTIDELCKLNRENKEGFVVRFIKNDFRIKIKHDDYKKLHKIISGLNDRHIIEWLESGVSFQSILKQLPNNVHDDILDKLKTFDSMFEIIKLISQNEIDRHKELNSKDLAKEIENHQYKSVIFAMRNHKDYEHVIWKIIKNRAKEKKEIK